MLDNIKNQNRLIIALSTLIAIALWVLFLYSDGLQGGMDSYNHYLIAKYSYKHPTLLLHYWGKPVYNLIASPFAQLGLRGSVALNIISLIGSAWFSYRTAQNLKLKFAFLAYIFVLLSPIFLDNTISSLTEPLNALILSICIYFFSANKTNTAAVLCGFLPYARTEGFVILAVVIFYLLFIEKKYKALILLLVGSLFFNTLGWIIEGKPFWIITENPYIKFQLSGDNVCGHGTFYHYFRWGHVTFGLINSLLLVLASFFVLKAYMKTRTFGLMVLILGIFAAYFGAHAFIWGAGMMGSCGYIRVMVVIAPLAAILSVYALEKLSLKWSKRTVTIVLLALIGNALYTPYKYYNYQYPMGITQEQQLYVELNKWYQGSEYKDRTLVYMYPYFSMIANRDPWDRNEHEELWRTSLPYLKKGDLVIWDGHFGPNEAGIPLEYLLNHKEFKLIHSEIPQSEFKTLNNYNFEIYVFEKLTESES